MIERYDELHATPRPPRGPGDGEDEQLPIGDPPDEDDTDDPDDDDEGEEDDVPLHGAPSQRGRARPLPRQLHPRSR